MRLRQPIPPEKRLYCPKKKSQLGYVHVPRVIYCQHCKEEHISPPCTNYCCMHMLKNQKAREYLKRNWPNILKIWEMNVTDELEALEGK